MLVSCKEVKKILDKNKMFAVMLQSSAKLSDRDLAKKAGTSQPTITRFRHRLEDKGIIKNYQVIPDFDKIGYPIFAILQIAYAAEKRVIERPEIIFQASTPLYIFALSVHKSFSQFVAFYRQIQQIADVKTVVLSLTKDITKHFEIDALDIDLSK